MAVGLSFVVSLVVFAGLLAKPGDDRQFTQILFQWLPVGNLRVDVGFLVDPLSITMVLFVTGIATLIHVYSIGYMHKDEKYSKFFIYMNMFVFSMLMLVLADNLVLTFVGLGRRGCLLLLPDLVLVHAGGERSRRQEGVRHEPHR